MIQYFFDQLYLYNISYRHTTVATNIISSNQQLSHAAETIYQGQRKRPIKEAWLHIKSYISDSVYGNSRNMIKHIHLCQSYTHLKKAQNNTNEDMCIRI